ncbi:NAD binding domain of 6-phosphogluconate dehydrogenase-domain-containing protein [Papiliotrema laurentii]|uniref:NAD binding domain of 6-phosphogluconate dehydrogenase-domain-containing protein n=1 Tax=Papiliotrema laurentii TaxID=5418 RepID=A0AAD9CXG8_PAPLA|nr:NAD binding domain of 6-phosphogluconate dehydrogenase-domain-containing protein [Papiliotrema laurentii]
MSQFVIDNNLAKLASCYEDVSEVPAEAPYSLARVTAAGIVLTCPEGRLSILKLIGDNRRLICSGVLAPGAAECLEQAGVIWINADPESASRLSVLEEGLCAVQTALAMEAMTLGISSGVDLDMCYHAISGAAGASWSFQHMVPELLQPERADGTRSLDTEIESLHRLTSLAGQYKTSLPVAALAKQIYQQAISRHSPTASCACLATIHPTKRTTREEGAERNILNLETVMPSKVAFVGLGAMGLGMAKVLNNKRFNVVGYDVCGPSRENFRLAGGRTAETLDECLEDSDVLVLMVVNARQVEQALFETGAADSLSRDATVILMSTVAPYEAEAIAAKLSLVRPDVTLLDSPVSGGTPRAATGDLTILCAGLDLSSEKPLAVLKALSGSQGHPDNLVFVPGPPGKAASVKLVNQHLAGSHIITVAETLALASSVGLPLATFRSVVLEGPAWSWMLGHRGQNMLNGLIKPPTSTVEIFIKDMGIVVQQAWTDGVGVPLAATVQQLFTAGQSQGWGGDDDSSIVRLWKPKGL